MMIMIKNFHGHKTNADNDDDEAGPFIMRPWQVIPPIASYTQQTVSFLTTQKDIQTTICICFIDPCAKCSAIGKPKKKPRSTPNFHTGMGNTREDTTCSATRGISEIPSVIKRKGD